MSTGPRVPAAGSHSQPGEPSPATDVLDTGRAGGLVMRGAVIRIVGYGAGSLLALLSAVLLTRHLGVDRFGQYTTIISVATLSTAVTDVGLTSLTTREYAAGRPGAREELMRDLTGLRIGLTTLAVLAAVVFAIAAGYDGTRVTATLLAAVGLGLASIQGLLAVPLLAGLRLGWVTSLELLRQAVLVSLVVVLVLAGAGLLPLLAALVPSSLAALLGTVWLIRGAMPLRPRLRAGRAVVLVRATAVFSLATGLGTIYVFAAQILTSLATTTYQTGLFSAAFRVFSVVATAAGLLISSAFPLLARAARDDRARLGFALQRLFEVATILGFGAALVAVAGAGPIVAVIAGPRYASSAPVLRIEGAALLASFVLSAWGYALISLRRHAALLVSSALSLSVTAVLTLVLARSHGATGGAIGVVGGEWVLAGAYLIALMRSGEELRPQPTVAVKVVTAALPAFAVMLLGLPGAWQLLASLAVYAAGLLALRAIPREVYELLPGRRAP